MWNIPTEERLAKIPRLYETEDTELKDTLLHLHFFMGGCDWYIAEYDGDDMVIPPEITTGYRTPNHDRNFLFVLLGIAD
jgi:hypothetical protein